ncbi:hypothetical protein [Cellulomonas gilvus]|uniref:Uncharacterized protein n=1 Tax=Cellulomonas gilvus (strain ATCC 13127 / NRRL B-14078) TaxID=593907 RepID=F8A7B5_CELGA|nr:hypothetical protein [Cellulomonas gilvus]AEI11173.1 hypothetical protein Celgi_0654 [Cellulomonas gilvus ATCC 13127]
MRWWARLRGESAEADDAAVTDAGADDESPQALRAGIDAVVRTINASGDDLPTAALANARHLTDTLTLLVDSAQLRPLDTGTALTVRAATQDYIPTTLRTYLALRPDLREAPGPDGATPMRSLVQQIATLQEGFTAILEARERRDADALAVQGQFLEAKFHRSDLDL